MNYSGFNETEPPKRIRFILLFFVVLVAVALKAKFIFQDSMWPDEALYLYIARNLSINITNLTDISGNLFYKSPPLLMYLISLVSGVSSIAFEQTARAVIVLMGAGTVLITYFIGKKVYRPLVGLTAAFLLALCPLTNWNGIRILTDVPVLFFVYLSICMLVYEKRPAFYVFAVCALLTKYTAGALLFLPLLTKLKPKIWGFLYLAVFVSLLAFVLSKGLFPAPEGAIGYFYRFFKFPDVVEIVREANFFLGIFVSVFAIVGLFLTIREKNYSALLHWVLFFGLCRIFLPWAAFRVSRYTLPLYPGIYLLASYGLFRSGEIAVGKWSRYKKWVILASLFCLAFVGYQHSIKSYRLLSMTSSTFVGFEEAGAFLNDQPEPHSLATASPRQMKYFAPDFDVYDITKNMTPEGLKKLIVQKGIEYICIDLWSLHLPAWCRSYNFQDNGYGQIYGKGRVFLFTVPKDIHNE